MILMLPSFRSIRVISVLQALRFMICCAMNMISRFEFGDIANILAYISIGDRIQDIERLVGALADIKRLYSKDPSQMLNTEYIAPKVVVFAAEGFLCQG